MPCDAGQIDNVENFTCAEGACGYDACKDLFADCDDDVVNGCETSVNTLDNCGMCGMKCEPENVVSPSCSTGVCEHGGCTGTFSDCDMDATNGCEADVTSNADHCGACNMACPGGGICKAGVCEVTKDAVDRGWHSDLTFHDSNNGNTLTGQSGNEQYNSYFVFDLTGLSGTVASAKLRMEIESYNSTDKSETVQIWDVSTSATVLDKDGLNQAVFQDLMSGKTYGTVVVKSSNVNTVMDIALGSQAVTDINQALGQKFSVGMHLNTIALSQTQWVRFSQNIEKRTHELVLTFQ